uniref:F-box domain-containing protein n=1 Tax=viral metagenome TaxID=1070528 RepID=A0A6C0C4V8_9ZZZZ
MEYLPNDVIYKILQNLTAKEEIFMRRVNTVLLSIINTSSFKITSYKLEKKLKRVNRIEKMKEDVICKYISLIGTIIYKEEKVHYYFRRREKIDMCIVKCGGERMGEVYHSKRSKNEYNKRYIPYCIKCFSKYE